jgi:hypothetical protein
MTDMQKKIAAAIAAVTMYLQAEGEIAALQFEQAAAAPPPAGPKLWALNGRQVQMQLRNLMQLRAIGRLA